MEHRIEIPQKEQIWQKSYLSKAVVFMFKLSFVYDQFFANSLFHQLPIQARLALQGKRNQIFSVLLGYLTPDPL